MKRIVCENVNLRKKKKNLSSFSPLIIKLLEKRKEKKEVNYSVLILFVSYLYIIYADVVNFFLNISASVFEKQNAIFILNS